jgi:hypothetical protein
MEVTQMSLLEVLFVASLVAPFVGAVGVVAVARPEDLPKGSKATVVEKRRAKDLKVRSNVRKTFPPDEELRSLARSVKRRQVHPLILLVDTILDGECRYRGMMLEDPDFEFDVIVVDKELSPAEVMETQLLSGIKTEALAPYDLAVAVRDWMALGEGTAKELAGKLDVSPGWVSKLASLWDCQPDVIEAAREGKIGPKAWYPISQLSSDTEAQLGLLAMHLSGMSGEQIASISRTKRRPKSDANAPRVDKLRCEVPGRSATVTVSGEKMTLAEVAQTLADLLALLNAQMKKGVTPQTFQNLCRDQANTAT